MLRRDYGHTGFVSAIARQVEEGLLKGEYQRVGIVLQFSAGRNELSFEL